MITLRRSRSWPPSRRGALLDEDDTTQNGERVTSAHGRHPHKLRARGLARELAVKDSSTSPLIIADTYDVRSPSAEKVPVTGACDPIPVGSSCASGSPSSENVCPICLNSMKPGLGLSLFTAECSHVFHFSCIASSVNHGNQFCPLCRGEWIDLPCIVGLERPKSPDTSRSSLSLYSEEATDADSHSSYVDSRDGHESEGESPMASLRSFLSWEEDSGPSDFSDVHNVQNFSAQNTDSIPSTLETDYCIDDELLRQSRSADVKSRQKLHLKMFPDVSAAPLSENRQRFTVLVNVKAPAIGVVHTAGIFVSNTCENSRAPVDLVAVLDASGSMSGRKWQLVKQTMSFLIHNLRCADLLSIVVLSSEAERILPLTRMDEEGQRQALQVLDVIRADGGSDITEGIRKAVNVLYDCLQSNPVSSIVLLSDGHDAHHDDSTRQRLLDLSKQIAATQRLACRECSNHKHIPIHTFGFGSDHDGETLKAISEGSGGLFSYVEEEEMAQDAFAQCIGRLLNVVAQDVQLTVLCPTPSVRIGAIHSGSYESVISENSCHGIVKLRDFHAEDERDVLVDLAISALSACEENVTVSVLQAICVYKDPFEQEVIVSTSDELSIKQPTEAVENQEVSVEVDRQRNRLVATASTITEAGTSADRGDIEAAQSGIQNARVQVAASPSAHAGHELCYALEAEHSKIEERMANRQLCRESGCLSSTFSAQSSHKRQRVSVCEASLTLFVHHQQTPAMINMASLSHHDSSAEANGASSDLTDL